MKKFLTTLAMLTLVTTPVFAQSFCTCDGTGNVMTFSQKSAAPQNEKAAFSRGGLQAYASAPGANLAAGPNVPASTGGGSLGYNEMLRNY